MNDVIPMEGMQFSSTSSEAENRKRHRDDNATKLEIFAAVTFIKKLAHHLS